MKIRNLHIWTISLAMASLVGTLLVGVPAANAATGANCKLNTPAAVASCDLITVALIAKVGSLDPSSPGRTFNNNYITKFLVQGALYRINEFGRPVFDLLGSRKVSADGLTWTLNLKPGQKYSDGVTPVTADDAVYMWDLIKKSPPPVFGAVKSMTSNGDLSIIIKLKTRFDELPYALSSLYFFLNPRSVVAGDAKYWEHPLSAGPYMIKSWVPGQDEFVVAVNPYYWAKPVVKQIRFVAVPDPATRVIALSQGTIDYSFDLPAAVARAQLSDKKVFRGIPVQIQGTFSVGFNLRSMAAGKPWTNVKVRQALSYAIDRERMAKVAFFGDVTPSCSFVWASSRLATCVRPGGIAQDLTKAKALLAEAGYANGFDITLVGFNRPGWVDSVNLIAADWKKIGVNTTVAIQPDAVIVANLTSGAFEAQFGGATGLIPTLALRTWYSATGPWAGWTGANSNDALLNAIDAAPASKKKAMLAQIETEMWNESAHIPLAQRAVYGATRLPNLIFQNVKGNDMYFVRQTPPLR